MNRPRILCLFGLSGSSKSTIEQMLVKLDGFKKVTSCTTRKIRDGEKNDKDYYYISEDEFQRLENGDEFAEVGGKYGGRYGVLWTEIVPNKINVLVSALDGISELKETGKYEMINIWLDCDVVERFTRIGKRNNLEYALKRIEKDGFRRDGEIHIADYVIDTTKMNEVEVSIRVMGCMHHRGWISDDNKVVTNE